MKKNKIKKALASYSRRFTVNNCTIPKCKVQLDEDGYNPKIKSDGNGTWKNDPKGYKLPKSLQKKTKNHPSEFPVHKQYKMNRVEFMESYVQLKLQKWEKKNPKPVKDNDMFKEEYMSKWNSDRQAAEERFRDFVISIYGKNIKTKPPKVVEQKEDTISCMKPFYARREYIYRDPYTKEQHYKISEELVDEKAVYSDKVGQSKTDYEHSIDKRVLVGMYKEDGKILKAYLPKNSTLGKKYRNAA